MRIGEWRWYSDIVAPYCSAFTKDTCESCRREVENAKRILNKRTNRTRARVKYYAGRIVFAMGRRVVQLYRNGRARVQTVIVHANAIVENYPLATTKPDGCCGPDRAVTRPTTRLQCELTEGWADATGVAGDVLCSFRRR